MQLSGDFGDLYLRFFSGHMLSVMQSLLVLQISRLVEERCLNWL